MRYFITSDIHGHYKELNQEQFQRKGGMTTDKARNNFYKNNK